MSGFFAASQTSDAWLAPNLRLHCTGARKFEGYGTQFVVFQRYQRRSLSSLRDRTAWLRQVEPTFAHLDFTWGITARWRVYPPVIRLLHRFS